MIQASFICSDSIAGMERFFPLQAPLRNTFCGLCYMLPVVGGAVVEIDNRPYHLSPGVLLTLLPGHVLQTVRRTADFRCLLLACTFDFMNDFPYMLQSCISEKMERMPYLSIKPEEQDCLREYYKVMEGHYSRITHHSYREILCSLFYVFTAEVCALYSDLQVKTAATRNEEITNDFFHLLHGNFRTTRDIAFYAGRICITPKHLAKVIRQVTGHAPSYWLADFTVRESCALLCSTSLSITELADSLNFSDSSFFARYFRRHTGMSPLEYRMGQSR